ncbi:ABC transporter ATP-binding protein, partial [Acinetobacter baumannii]
VEDWLTQSKRAAALQAKATPAAAPTPPPAPEPAPVVATKRKLSYKEQRERDALPTQLAAREAEHTQLNSLSAGSELYTQGAKRI